MRFKRALLAALVLALTALLASNAGASCQWEWVCDASGDCAHVPLCDNSIEIVPVEPPSIQPIAPPSIEPIAVPRVPPIGTRSCDQVRRRDAFGSWYWDTVCH